VIADVVSPIGGLAYQFRISPSEAAHQKKRRGRPVAFQQLQEFRRACWVWPVIEGERDQGSIWSVVQGGAKELRSRRDSSPGCDSRASSHRGKSEKSAGVHARILARGLLSLKTNRAQKRVGVPQSQPDIDCGSNYRARAG
jgi:hypothetical protein